MKELRFEVGDKVKINGKIREYAEKTGVVTGLKSIPESNAFSSEWSVEVALDDSHETRWFAEEFLEKTEEAGDCGGDSCSVDLPEAAEGRTVPPYRAAVEKMLDRQEQKGLDKYGVTLDQNVTLTSEQRIEHLEEELIDALMYCEHLKAGIEGGGLTVDDYQRAALRTARMDEFTKDELFLNGVMGLCGEAGEVIDMAKKARYQGHELEREDFIKELGDVAWYLSLTAYAYDVPLSEVFEKNISKLKDRYPEGFSKERSIHREGEE